MSDSLHVQYVSMRMLCRVFMSLAECLSLYVCMGCMFQGKMFSSHFSNEYTKQISKGQKSCEDSKQTVHI